MKLFIDEDLSPQLVRIGHTRGYDSSCVRDRGQLSRKDQSILRLCVEEDRVLVTSNAGDFRGLVGDVELHPGLVILPSVNRERQLRLLETALQFIEEQAAAAGQEPRDLMVNRVIEVDQDGGCEIFQLPTPP